MKELPLAGIRVADLSMMWAGPFCTRLLGEMGEQHKVPMGAVMTPLDLLANKSLEERGFFDSVATPAGEARVPGRPFLGVDWRAGELHAPAADTDAVARDWLGARA